MAEKYKSGIFCEPVIESNRLYFGTETGTVYAINIQNTNIEWQRNIGKRIAVSSPVMERGVLYIGNNSGIFYSIESRTSKVLWEKNLKSKILSRPVVENNAIFVMTVNGGVYSIKLNGEINWKVDIHEETDSSFEIADKRIILPTKQGNLYIIKTENGFIEQTSNFGKMIINQPVKDKDAIYITTLKGKVYSLRTEHSQISNCR